MAIRGHLRDLGVHEIFQLLDLGRKTGVLRVSSAVRENAGEVAFQHGAVVAASIRTNPHPLGLLLRREARVPAQAIARARAMQQDGDARRLGELLVEMDAITTRELARCIRVQIETVVFELLSWHEGEFAFVETAAVPLPSTEVRISAPALLMEASRRLGAWSAVGDVVRDAGVIPRLAVPDEPVMTPIDLDGVDWAILAEIDGVRSIREIAGALGTDEFDVARSVHGMVMTTLVEVAA